MRLVLASTSPRRRDLLATLRLSFDVEPIEVDETRYTDEPPDDYVERVARAKAEAAAGPGVVTVGADTAVVAGGHVLGKPAHPDEARRMLELISGRVHEVTTGVAVTTWDEGPETVSCVERTLVRMVPLTGEEITAYIATGEPMDKAGAYALQGLGGAFVESVQGSPSTVLGLPLHATTRLLRAVGIDPLAEL